MHANGLFSKTLIASIVILFLASGVYDLARPQDITSSCPIFPAATGKGSPTESEDPLDELLNGTGAYDNELFGWNVSYLGDINDDGYDDIGVGAPMNTTYGIAGGAVYIFFGGPKAQARSGISADTADAVVLGTGTQLLGWDLDAAGDVNGDGVDDMVVGAPGGGSAYNGQVFIFFGYKNFQNTTTAQANRTYDYQYPSGNLGFSVTGCGDLDTDGFFDVAAGAPAYAQAMVFPGYPQTTKVFMNLWDDNTSTPGIVDFSVAVNNTPTDINTWGFDAGNDGWDWTSNAYYTSQGTDMDYEYAAPEAGGSDADGVTIDGTSTLQVMIGRSKTAAGPTGSPHFDSGAWGIQIPVNASAYALVNAGYHLFVQFDYRVHDIQSYFDVNFGTEERMYLKSRFTNATGPKWLGNDLGGDTDPDVYFKDLTGTMYSPFQMRTGHFEWDVSQYVNGSDNYYWDFGAVADFVYGANKGQDEGISAFFDNVSAYLQIYRPPLTIQGMGGFGWDMDGGLDMNGDNRPDLIVSDPIADPLTGSMDNRGAVYLFAGKANFQYSDITVCSDYYDGPLPGGMTGFSVAQIPDMNGDGCDEVLAGAPDADQAHIWYGHPAAAHALTYSYYPPWDDDPVTTPYTTSFELAVNNTPADKNTWGIYSPPSASDDGWDWTSDVYGGTTANNWYGFYSPNEGGVPDVGTPPPRGSTQRIGGYVQGINTANSAESLSWGCQFNISDAMNTSASSGDVIYLAYNYELWDMETGGQGTEEPIHLKARAGHSNSTMTYLGGSLDGGGLTLWYWTGAAWVQCNFVDRQPEVYLRSNWQLGGGANFGTERGAIYADITHLINKTAPFYIDIGMLYYTGQYGYGGGEGAGVLFDNITLLTVSNAPVPNVTISGTRGENFGHSVAMLSGMNKDARGDFIIGSFSADNAGGTNAGATYTFFGSSSLSAKIDAEDADYINYGDRSNAYFGFSVGGSGKFMASPYTDPLVGCPGYDDGSGSVPGKAYVLGVPQRPLINVLSPNGGETVFGTISLDASASDPYDDLNLVKGVHFQIRPDGGSTWTEVGFDVTASAGDHFNITFDTRTVPDGNYWLRANCSDLVGNAAQDISNSYFTIDNPWNPVINITSPGPPSILNGTISIAAHALDPDGALNYTRGVEFYYSMDNGTADPWHLIGVDNVTTTGNDFMLATWNITLLPDGLCYIKANVSDNEGLYGEGISNFTIQNPKVAPVVSVLNPWNISAELAGSVKINATAFDANNDINASGVTFYYSKEGGPWVLIGSDPAPSAGVYEITWASNAVTDGLYAFKVEATDLTNLTGYDITAQFKVHNNLNNPPIVSVLYPNEYAEFSQFGFIKLRAFVFDLENNVNSEGARFYYSSDDRMTWIFIGNDPSGTNNVFEVDWDTESVLDGIYWFMVNATDLTGNTGEDTSNSSVMIHNKMDNAPRLSVIYPNGGESVSGIVNVTCRAFDFENNINPAGVTFSYSPNGGQTWSPIGSTSQRSGSIYYISWDTTAVADGNRYLINASATDITSRTGMDISNATFTVKNNVFSRPEVDIREPEAGSTVSGAVNVTAWAFDLDGDISAQGVEFYYRAWGNTSWVQIGSDPEGDADDVFLVTWDTNTSATPNGDYLLMAEVTDAQGLNATSMLAEVVHIENKVEVVPGEEHAPEVTINDPETDDILSATETISVTATDADGDLKWVEFYYQPSGGSRALIANVTGSSSVSTYERTWDTDTSATPDGDYTIYVVAKDSKGHTDEASVSISVSNGVTPPPDDDDDDDGVNLLWWIVGISLLLLLLIVMIVIIIIVLRKRGGVEVRIGPFLHEEKPLDGRVTLVIDGTEYSGGTDKDGVAHILRVPSGKMGKSAKVMPEFSENKAPFEVKLEKDVVIPIPSTWAKKLDRKPVQKAQPMSGTPAAQAASPIAAPSDMFKAWPKDKPFGVEPPPKPAAIDAPSQTKALPPASETAEGTEAEKAPTAELPEDEIDVEDDAAPPEEKAPEMAKEDKEPPKKATPAKAPATGKAPVEIPEDEIDLDKDLSLDELSLDADDDL